MVHDRAISMDSFTLDQPAIEPELICHAWLKAHFRDPRPDNPLTLGLFHGPADPLSPAPSSTMSVAPPGFPAGVTPPKRPRQFPDPANGLLDDNDDGFHSRPPRSHPNPHDFSAGGRVGPRMFAGDGNFAPGWPNPDGRQPPGAGVGTGILQASVGAASDTNDQEDNGDDLHDNASPSSWDSSMRSRFTEHLVVVGGRNVAMLPPSNNLKRKAGSRSPTKSSTGKASSDTREKRRRLTQFVPPGAFGNPDVANTDPNEASLMPKPIIQLLRVTFSVGYFETACFPLTAEIEGILTAKFPHESIPPHAQFHVPDTPDGNKRARELVEYVIDIHRGCLQNSSKGEDEAAWYPLVRGLLSISAPPQNSTAAPIPSPPSFSFTTNKHDLFLTIDATTKNTLPHLEPAVTIKLDALLAFNHAHPLCAPVLTASVRVNAFSDTIIRDNIVILGVEVKSAAAGGMEAEYQIGVWGMKTLNLMRALRGGVWKCEYAVGLSVCAHVWSYHVSYWRGDAIVTHGPVCIGATDSLYGTMKVVAFVRRFKEWARDVLLAEWMELVESAEAEGRGEVVE